MKKSYTVSIQNEYFQKRADGYYQYICLVDFKNDEYFKNLEEAKRYIDNYDMTSEKDNHALYLSYLSLFKYDEIIDSIYYLRG